MQLKALATGTILLLSKSSALSAENTGSHSIKRIQNESNNVLFVFLPAQPDFWAVFIASFRIIKYFNSSFTSRVRPLEHELM